MLYFYISAICGIGGGIFSSQFFKEYSLGTLGNVVTGFLGGIVTHTVIVLVVGGTAFSLAIVGGFIGGVIVRVAFSIIRQRMSSDS
jgi:uncharacterized membrane protein YeaQ/YmgE (transglycosylase-associated protein family)